MAQSTKPRRKRARLSPLEFFAQNAYFCFQEFAYGRSRAAAARALAYHVEQKRLLQVRRGTYMWRSLAKMPDAPSLASRLGDDAVLAYSGALEFHGALWRPKLVTFLSPSRVDIEFAEVRYLSVDTPVNIRRKGEYPFVTAQVRGMTIVQATTLERTYVDCLDRPDLGPALDVLWRSFSNREPDAKQMVEYAMRLGNRVTMAKLGLFLQCHPRLQRQHDALDVLESRRPSSQARMNRSVSPHECEPFHRWNLSVPSRLLDVLDPKRHDP
jgi:predicted transcriptional regulator of viral defense system